MAFVLIGFMGAGKSTGARELAAATGGAAHDSDAELEQRFGHAVASEFELHGEDAFRASEEQLVCEMLARARDSDVVALGGGSVLSERVRQALAAHITVLLEIGPELAWERIGGSRADGQRPLARDRDRFAALAAARAPLYERLAQAYVPPLAPGGLRATLPALRALAAAPAGTRMLWASAASGQYPVLVGAGLISGDGGGDGGVVRGASPTAGAAAQAAVWPLDRSRSRSFCVSDENVAPLYGGRLGPLAATVLVAPGEHSKTLAGAERVWQGLLQSGMTRADHVVALGGGVVGDLAGFCAATYQRGVPVVHVPTTLVAQVDSAYGGKTGVDLAEAKNYVGAYHQPAGVLVDPETLASLPAAEVAAGWVEVLKTALVAGGELWERVACGAPPDAGQIFACARTKLAIVAEDERDSGRRQALNLGHTVGHAIEAATSYRRYRHGEAVGVGLLAALRLSGQDALRERVAGLLGERGLPVTFEGAGVEDVLAALARDKKRLAGSDAGRVPFVLVSAPGEIEIGCEVREQELRAAVAELCR